jgi:aminopeptidase-like protein
MTVYCKVCGAKIGQVTHENLEQMKLRYAYHFIIHRKPEEIVGSICWTTEKKKKKEEEEI